jgi:hypothetical protein
MIGFASLHWLLVCELRQRRCSECRCVAGEKRAASEAGCVVRGLSLPLCTPVLFAASAAGLTNRVGVALYLYAFSFG